MKKETPEHLTRYYVEGYNSDGDVWWDSAHGYTLAEARYLAEKLRLRYPVDRYTVKQDPTDSPAVMALEDE